MSYADLDTERFNEYGDDRIGEPLPPWAHDRARGDYTLPGAALPTRDGRATGNAVNVGGILVACLEPTFLVVTDAGNILKLNVNELKELFYPPEFIMRDLLPAHRVALQEWNNASS